MSSARRTASRGASPAGRDARADGLPHLCRAPVRAALPLWLARLLDPNLYGAEERMIGGARDELRSELLRAVPRWYSPWLHLAIPAVSGIAVLAFALSRVEDLRAWQLLLVPVFLVFGNAVEWHAHRGLLHRRTWPLQVLYLRHTPQHHAIYVAGDMAIRDWRELKFVLLPAYGVVGLVAVTSPVTIALSLLGQPNLAALWVGSVVSYVLVYEWLHLAYHLPAGGFLGGLRVTRWLRRHHERHHAPHLMHRWNFNVTIPLWDLVHGTVHREPRPSPGAAEPRRASGTTADFTLRTR